MARPSEYNLKMCEDICELIAEGGHIIDVLNDNEDFPSWSTFRRWKRDHEELRTLYVNAQQDKTEPITHNIKTVQKMALEGKIEASTANVVIQTDKWFASKFYPKMFGDKVDVTSDGKHINALPPAIEFVDADED